MAVTRNRGPQDRHRAAPQPARRREVLEAVVLLGVLVLLAIVARLPAG
jgi:hypothetical protein